jgi:hypothetical protein
MARPAAFVREWDHHEDREGHEGLPDASGHGEWVPGEGISGRVERANPKTRTRFKLRTGNPWRVVYVYPRLCDDFVDVMNPKSIQDIEARMQYLLEAPKDRGTLKMIVIRHSSNERREVASCRVSLKGGADGDHWAQGCWKSLPDGSPDPDVQLTLMNYRMLEVLSEDASRRSLAGDNLCVDLDLSADNLKAGDRLAIGGAILEITAEPHNGCKKFKERFGADALVAVNSEQGKALHLRGIYARVVRDGAIHVGDEVAKVTDGSWERGRVTG